MKKLTAILLALMMLLSLAACAPSAGGGASDGTAGDGADGVSAELLTTTGQYREREITPPELSDRDGEISGLWADEDGVIDMTCCEWNGDELAYVLFHSDDGGESWTSTALETDYTMRDSAGTFYGVEMEDSEEDSYVLYLNYRLADGTAGRTELKRPEGSAGFDVWGSYCLAGDQYILLTVNDGEESYDGYPTVTLYAFDLSTGETVWQYRSEQEYIAFNTVEDRVYVDEYNGSGRGTILDLATGEASGTFDTDVLRMDLQSLLLRPDGGYYYYSYDVGSICFSILDQDLEEVVLEGVNYGFSIVSDWGQDIRAVLSDGTIFYSSTDGQSHSHVFRFDFDEAAGAIEATLVVWALQDTPTLRRAINAFRQAHPEVLIDFQLQSLDYDAGQTTADLISRLNTQLLNGEGPDVILFDGVDYTNYIDAGVLLDLSGLVTDTDFVGQSVSAMRADDGGYYVLPARFSVSVLYGENLDAPGTLDALADAVCAAGVSIPDAALSPQEGYMTYGVGGNEYDYQAQEAKQHAAQVAAGLPYLALSSIYELAEMTWEASADAILDGGSLNEDALRQWLEPLKRMSDHHGFFAGTGESDVAESESAVIGSVEDNDYGNLGTETSNNELLWAEGEALAAAASLQSVEQLLLASEMHYNVVTDSDGQSVPLENFSVVPFPGLTEGVYQPEVLLAVNAASEHAELGKEFVSYALLMEIQQYTYGDGLPVLRAAMDQQLDYFASYAEKYGWDITVLDGIFDTLTTPVSVDDEVYEDVLYTVSDYLRGEATLDEAVSQVRDALALRLAEQ